MYVYMCATATESFLLGPRWQQQDALINIQFIHDYGYDHQGNYLSFYYYFDYYYPIISQWYDYMLSIWMLKYAFLLVCQYAITIISCCFISIQSSSFCTYIYDLMISIFLWMELFIKYFYTYVIYICVFIYIYLNLVDSDLFSGRISEHFTFLLENIPKFSSVIQIFELT